MPEGRTIMGYLNPRKRWYQRTVVRVILVTALVYAMLTAVLVLTPCR